MFYLVFCILYVCSDAVNEFLAPLFIKFQDQILVSNPSKKGDAGAHLLVSASLQPR